MNQRLAVLRSVTIVSVATYIEYALGLVMSVWIARALGPADFGRYAFTMWLCRWLISCSNHALTTSSMKFIAESDGAGRPDLASHIAGRLNRIQHASLAVVTVVFVLGALLIQPSEWQRLMAPMIALSIVAVAARANYAMHVAIAKGQERFETEAIATVLAGAIGVGLIAVAAAMHADLIAFIAIYAVSSLLLNLINRIVYRKLCRPFQAGPIPEDLRQRVSRHLRLTAVLMLLISIKGGTIEVFLLNTFSSSVAVGFFAIAFTLTRGAVELFSVGLTATLLPYMAKSYGQHGQERAARFLAEATRFYWFAGIAIAGIGLVVTPQLVTLMYGQRYVQAIPTIESILVLSGLLLIANGIIAFQTVVDRQDDRIRISVAALVANVLLGAALVPTLGLPGAVLTFTGTRLAELALALYYLRRITRDGIPWLPMLRLAAVGAVSTGIAWSVTHALAGHFGFLAGAAVFLGLYLPAGVLVRYWTTDDYALLATIAGRLGGPGRWVLRGLQTLRARAA